VQNLQATAKLWVFVCLFRVLESWPHEELIPEKTEVVLELDGGEMREEKLVSMSVQV
jgi:hypothetical protein